jgi:hypothetical protein
MGKMLDVLALEHMNLASREVSRPCRETRIGGNQNVGVHQRSEMATHVFPVTKI